MQLGHTYVCERKQGHASSRSHTHKRGSQGGGEMQCVSETEIEEEEEKRETKRERRCERKQSERESLPESSGGSAHRLRSAAAAGAAASRWLEDERALPIGLCERVAREDGRARDDAATRGQGARRNGAWRRRWRSVRRALFA
eukprot:6189380-Pleurochrysis_carterae.AAC.1